MDLNKLLFFNKEGFPYNFNIENSAITGKILFDENGSDTFKTLGMYIFEDVSPIDVSGYFNMKKFEFYNLSGTSFYGKTNTNFSADSIIKVNQNSSFYSKWIYGTNIDKKFPTGTIITTNQATLPDYYVVISTKSNAILIINNINNSIFTNIIATIINPIIINSVNIISTLYDPLISGASFVTDKKISIINSTYNDSVVSFLNSASSYTNVVTTSMLGTTGDTLNIYLTVLSERFKLYQGDISVLGNNLTLINGNNSNLNIGDEIIITDTLGNNIPSLPIMNILNKLTEETITGNTVYFNINSSLDDNNDTVYRYFVSFSSTTSLQVNDIIRIDYSGVTGLTLLNNSKLLTILAIYTSGNLTTLEVKQPVYNEIMNYNIVKLLNKNQQNTYTINYSITSAVTNCIIYSTNINTTLSQNIVNDYPTTISTLVNKYSNLLNTLGINIFYNSGLTIESIYETLNPYYSISAITCGVSALTLNNTNVNKMLLNVTEQLTKEKHLLSNPICEKFNSKILFDLNSDGSLYGFKITINNDDYYINYNISTEQTIIDFLSSYGTILYSKGIDATLSGTNILVLNSNYYDVDVYNFVIRTNKVSTYSILNYVYNKSIILSSNEIRSVDTIKYDYTFNLPSAATYLSGTSFIITDNLSNVYTITLGADTSREDVLILFNTLGIGIWTLDTSLSYNIYYATDSFPLDDDPILVSLEIIDPIPPFPEDVPIIYINKDLTYTPSNFDITLSGSGAAAIDWSDGTVSNITLTSTPTLYNHTISTSNTDPIRIGGNNVQYADITNSVTLTTIDISQMSSLTYFSYHNCSTTIPIDVSHNPNLLTLYMGFSPNLSYANHGICNTNLQYLDFGTTNANDVFIVTGNTQLTTMTSSSVVNFSGINCSHNALTSFSGSFTMGTLLTLDISYNNFTTFTIPNNVLTFNCSHNNLTTLNTNNVVTLDCSYNSMTSFTAGNSLTSINIANNNLTGTLNTTLQNVNCDNNVGLNTLTYNNGNYGSSISMNISGNTLTTINYAGYNSFSPPTAGYLNIVASALTSLVIDAANLIPPFAPDPTNYLAGINVNGTQITTLSLANVSTNILSSVYLQNDQLSTAALDGILDFLNAASVNNGILNINGNVGTPTGSKVTTLQGKGWTITT